MASQVAQVKNLPANSGDTADTGFIPGLGKSPRGGNGNPLQYSFLENPMDRGAWWATACQRATGCKASHMTEHKCSWTITSWDGDKFVVR